MTKKIVDPQQTIEWEQFFGESVGYSPEARDRINESRKAQVDRAVETNRLKSQLRDQARVEKLKSGSSGNYNSQWGLRGDMAGGDPFTALAQILGQVDGINNSNFYATSYGGATANPAAQSQEALLKPLYENLLKQQEMQTKAMEQQMKMQQEALQPKARGGGVMKSNDPWSGRGDEEQDDPYKELRDAIIKSAIAYNKR